MRIKTRLPVPFDVRLMNFTASALFLAFGLLLVATAGWWALSHPRFALGGITVQGDVTHASVVTMRANALPRLTGNFFMVSLDATRQAFESVPWVRKAVVRREFPNRLRVSLQEHRAVAIWGPENDGKLVNSFGEMFEANVGDVEQNLPRLAGPDGQSAQVLAMYQALVPLFQPLDLGVEQLLLTGRGSWRVTLDTRAEVELGRGSRDEVTARTRRFLQTLGQVTAKHDRRPEALVSADLRHENGYAVRLRGVSTTSVDVEKTKKK